MAATKQDNVFIEVTTPLGPDALVLRAIRGEEYLSGLFHYELTMTAESAGIDFSAVVGKPATVTLHREDGKKRVIHGIMTRFGQAGTDARYTAYRGELRPWTHFLTLSLDCEIFQEMTVPDIIEAVLGDLGYSDFTNSTQASYEPRDYAVQYQETAFNFITRLMEEEGIFYFFKHEDSAHTLVFADDLGAHEDCPDLATVRYRHRDLTSQEADVITECLFEQQVTSGKYSTDDYNFETPSTQLLAKMDGEGSDMEVYEYPGLYATKDDGERYAKIRMEALEAPTEILHGSGEAVGLVAGYKFTLEGYDRAAANTEYVLRRVGIDATETSFRTTFEAFPASRPFRPDRRAVKPRIYGLQTAKVVGQSGEEIWTDEYGRVKVKFHWDQKGAEDETASCWVRVAHNWAGKSWGTFFLPRIGQEVVVSFLEGDPDRPMVVGAVYNAENTVPYDLPAEATKSTMKSNVSKGGGGFNEIRFEDKKDAEEIYVHAQKDMNITVLYDRVQTVKNDSTYVITNDRTETIEKGNDSLTIEKGNRSIDVQKGTETHKVKGTRDLTVTGDETHINKADYTQKVTGDYTLKVSGDLLIQVAGKIVIKSDMDTKIKAGMNMDLDAGMNMKAKAGMNAKFKAGMGMDLEAGMTLKAKSGMMMDLKGGMMLKGEGGMMNDQKGGMMMKTKGGMMHQAEGGLMGEYKGGVMGMLKGGIVMIG